MAHDVFISYASEDKSVADAVCASLESHSVRCWIAPRDVLPGVSYGEAIIEAILACRIMVLVLSSKSNLSPHIPKEIERAVSRGISVIPFRIEDVLPGKSLDYFIGSVHWLDALTPPLERHLERLAQNVETLLAEIPRQSSLRPLHQLHISLRLHFPVIRKCRAPVSTCFALVPGFFQPWLWWAFS
jgi:TIR domain